MNTHDKINKLLAAFALGELSPQQSAEVQTHLTDCTRCRDELGDLKALLECTESMRRLSADERQCESAKQTILAAAAQQKAARPAAGPAAAIESVWRIIMKSPLTKLATAAVLVIAAVVGVSPFRPFLGGTVTFAEVVEPILNARTVILDLVIGRDESGPVMHEIVVGSRIRRTISNLPNITQILDLDGAKMLALDTEAKTASYVDIQGPLQERTKNYVEFLRQVIIDLQKDPDIEELGERLIDGHKAIGFSAKRPNEEVTIWADPKTARPIRVELRVGQMFVILKNFELNAPVEDSLVSMDVPPGYTLQDTKLDLSGATEQDFVESLRIWAEVLSDGTFPDAIGTENVMKQVPLLAQKLGQMNLSEDKATQLAMSFARGMLFHQLLDSQGAWRYAGKGVKLGDAAAPIFWYQPKDSETYRVIYGDLSVKNVAQQDLHR